MKKLKSFRLMSIVLMGVFTFTACGSDDDDNGGGSTSAGVIDAETCLRLYSAGDYSFSYDNEGRLSAIATSGARMKFSYNPNTITGFDDDYVFNVSYNGSGYVTRVTYNSSWSEDGDSENSNGSLSFSYDGNGRLTKISASENWSGVEDGERYSGSGLETATLTYSETAVLRYSDEVTWKEDGESETEKYEGVFKTGGENKNKYLQFPASLAGNWLDFDVEIVDGLAFAGLLGKGPAQLPDELAETRKSIWREDGETGSNEESNNYNFSYGFNNDGSLSYCYAFGRHYNYSYDHASVSTTPSYMSLTTGAKAKKHGRRLHHR